MKKFLLNKTLFPKEFWIITLIKIIVGSMFASHYVTKGFLPFIHYFISTGKNPYDYFFVNSNIVFPYPSGMLVVLDPLLSLGHLIVKNLFFYPNLSLFIFRLPIILADVVIYIILCKLLPSKEKKVLWLYFASPILFYINYFHGQLDVIPTAFLIASLYFLYIRKNLYSIILLGVGMAMKTHLFITLPFYVIYFYRKKIKFLEIAKLLSASLLIFLLLNIPFFSKSYLLTVFNNVEQQRLFFTVFSYQYKELTLLIAPAALLICFYIFASNKKLNFDSLILMLGLIFTILIALVPPMQGWFYWSIPLFIYFIIKYKGSPPLSFILMNIFFIAFFILIKDSDIFESASATFPSFSTLSTPYQILESNGFDALRMQSVLFTCLQISVAVNAYWCYKLGIYYNNLYIERQKPFTLGIGGDSGVGKSTLSEAVTDLIGKIQITILNGDDSHKWERSNKNWRIFTHLDPKANSLHKDVEQLYALVDGKTIERVSYDHRSGKFTKTAKVENNQFVIFQGLHPFFLEKMRQVYDIKIFLEAEENLRRKWKSARDTRSRGYKFSRVNKEITRRKKDSMKFISPQKKFADWIISYSKIKDTIIVSYTFSNSIPMDPLINYLSDIPGIKVKHEFLDAKQQKVRISGKISKKLVAEIAYNLVPNLNELVNNQPIFRDNSQGLNQLFFLNYLNFHLADSTNVKNY